MKTLLILRPKSGIATKTINSNFEVISSYDKHERQFTFETIPYKKLNTVLKQKVFNDKSCFIVLGELTGYGKEIERKGEYSRRLKNEKEGNPATIQDRDGAEIVLDIDKKKDIPNFDPLNPGPPLKAWLESKGVYSNFTWQLSSSQKLDTNIASVHIFLELDTPRSLSDRKAWAKSIGCDPSVYTCCHAIYTASPIIQGGGIDQIKKRVGSVKGKTETFTLPEMAEEFVEKKAGSFGGNSEFNFNDPNLPENVLSGKVYRTYFMRFAQSLANKGHSVEKIVSTIREKSLLVPEENRRDFDEENVRQYSKDAVEKRKAEKSLKKSGTTLEDLKNYCANGESENMEKQMLEDIFVLKGLAILGQWTVFYAGPGRGKTLLTLWLLAQAIKEGEINGGDVFYANCDDNFKGGYEKLKIAEEIGFRMLIPNVKGFTAKVLIDIMENLSQSGEAKGKIIILDTLKKFTDLMDKKMCSDFGTKARLFVSAGGTLICLAHVNKNRGSDNKSIAAGTSDIPDDADCVFTIENISPKIENEGISTVVKFENKKSRGNVERESSFKYFTKPKTQGGSYRTLFDSVCHLTPQDIAIVQEENDKEKRRAADQEIINSVSKFIVEKELGKIELVHLVMEDTGASRSKVVACLNDWTGEEPVGLWQVVREGKNKSVYRKNGGIVKFPAKFA